MGENNNMKIGVLTDSSSYLTKNNVKNMELMSYQFQLSGIIKNIWI